VEAAGSADLELCDHSGLPVTRDTAEQHVTACLQFDAAGGVLVGQCLKGEIIYALDAEVVVDGAVIAQSECGVCRRLDACWGVGELGSGHRDQPGWVSRGAAAGSSESDEDGESHAHSKNSSNYGKKP